MTPDLYTVGNIIEVQPRRHKFKTNEYRATGSVPIIDQSTDFIAGFTDETDRAYDGELPVIIFGDHTCCLKFIDFRFAVGADGTQLLRPVEGLDARYLYYALHAVDLKQFGYQRHFKLLKDCEVRVPCLEAQRRIASILGGYDDLIEVNRRRISVLEEMARALFEEWFVRFRFPGHEAVPILDTPEGPLPEGWRLAILGELCSGKTGIQTGPFGSQLHQEDYVAEGVPVVMPKNIIDLRIQTDGIARIPDDLAQSLGRHLMDEGDIVYGRRGDIGRRAFISKDEAGFFCGTGCLRLRPDQRLVAPSYLFMALGTVETEGAIKARATGATMPNLSAGVMKEVPVLAPPKAIQWKFDAVIQPIQNLTGKLIAANRVLATSRDLLLPRLISGQLSVAEAEHQLEKVA